MRRTMLLILSARSCY